MINLFVCLANREFSRRQQSRVQKSTAKQTHSCSSRAAHSHGARDFRYLARPGKLNRAHQQNQPKHMLRVCLFSCVCLSHFFFTCVCRPSSRSLACFNFTTKLCFVVVVVVVHFWYSISSPFQAYPSTDGSLLVSSIRTSNDFGPQFGAPQIELRAYRLSDQAQAN